MKINNFEEKIKLFKNVVDDSYIYGGVDKTFSIFKVLNSQLLYLAYQNECKSIIFYDLINFQKINEIKNAHQKHINSLRYYFDKNNKRDLIMSISYEDNNLKLWNINNFICILNMKKVNQIGYLYSACMLNDNNQKVIITSNFYSEGIIESIKVFDINGNKIKEINDSKDNIVFIDNYYDIKKNSNFIITGNVGFIKSYDYIKNKLYYKYSDNDIKGHFSAIVINNNEKIILIESSSNGYIRIWNFHTAELLNKIKVSNNGLNGICLWDHKYLFVGCDDKEIKIVDFIKGNVSKNLIGHNQEVLSIQKFTHPIYGECLVSQSLGNDKIKLWIIRNK